MSKRETKKARVTISMKEYQKLKQSKVEVNDELVFAVLKHKLYWMLSNAQNRTKTRDEYKNVKYRLGNYKDGYRNLIKNRPDLHEKMWDIMKNYIEKGFIDELAPSIHRTRQHYEWETIDILTVDEHIKLDNAKETAVATIKDGKLNSLTVDIFESKKEAQNTLNISAKTLDKMQKEICDLAYQDEEGNLVNTGCSTIPMNFVRLKPKSEEEFKKMCIEYGLIYKPKIERDALLKKLKRLNGII